MQFPFLHLCHFILYHIFHIIAIQIRKTFTKILSDYKTNTHIEVLPPSVYALRGIIFYKVAKINQNLYYFFAIKFIYPLIV